MTVTVETLEKLERKITLTVPVTAIQSEVDARLKKMARTVKMDGFRPGKVPMNVVAQRYGYSVQYEVLNDKVGEAFAVAANEANLRVAGQPRITEKEGAPEGQVTFDAIFEVFPEVKIADLTTAEIEKLNSEVSESAIQKTLDIQRAGFRRQGQCAWWRRIGSSGRGAARHHACADRLRRCVEARIEPRRLRDPRRAGSRAQEGRLPWSPPPQAVQQALIESVSSGRPPTGDRKSTRLYS
eukprot:gene19735-27934_t